MEPIKTAVLTETQKQELAMLQSACQTEHTGIVEFPTEDTDLFFLLYETWQKPRLVSVLFLIMPQFPDSDEAAECIAFTHPDARRRGYFSLLFEKAQEEIKDLDLLFPTDGHDEGALHALESLGAEFSHAEYRMELTLSDSPFLLPDRAETDIPSPASRIRLSCLTEETGDSVRRYAFYPALKAPDSGPCSTSGDRFPAFRPSEPLSAPAAVCYAARSGKSACFYGFSVRPGLQNKGLGSEALRLALLDLEREGIQRLILHVSGDNLPAMAVYKKAGFRITETLSYYIY